jgi:hypothetical protein
MKINYVYNYAFNKLNKNRRLLEICFGKYLFTIKIKYPFFEIFVLPF